MRDELYGFSNMITDKIKAEVDKVIAHKLEMMESKALMNNQLELAEILHNMDINHLEKTKRDLEKAGYTIEMTYPQSQVTNDGNIYKAIIDPNQIKIKVRKLIMEV